MEKNTNEKDSCKSLIFKKSDFTIKQKKTWISNVSWSSDDCVVGLSREDHGSILPNCV